MTKTKRFVLFVAFFVIILSLSSVLIGCGFVDYVSVDDAIGEQTEIVELREFYIDKLRSESSAENYRDEERREYDYAVIDAVNELNECETADGLLAVYEKHSAVIAAIKTDFILYSEETIAKIEICVDVALYRSEQAEIIENLLADSIARVRNCESKSDMDNVYREYVTSVYDIPTSIMLYKEELAALVVELSDNLSARYKPTDYREEQRLQIQALLGGFYADAERVETKEALFEIYARVKDALDGFKTDSALKEEERQALLIDLRIEMIETIKAEISDDRWEEYFDRADAVCAEMCDRQSELGIKTVCYTFLREFSVRAVAELLKCYNGAVEYGEREQSEVNGIKAEYLALFTDSTELSQANAIFARAAAEIDNVKTYAELCREEVADFRTALKELYGDEILQEPRSLLQASDYDELADIIDYYAFYQTSGNSFVCGSFAVKMNFDFADEAEVVNNVYWKCKLLRSGAGIHARKQFDNYVVFDLVPYDIASTSNGDRTDRIDRHVSLTGFDSEISNPTKRSDDFDEFAYYDYGRRLKVWNSQQLWYALENEYVPVCAIGSPAERNLNRAKEILREIICDGMSDYEKMFAIYKWFGANVQYDDLYWSDFYQSVLEKYPEAADSKAFHIDGGLFDGLAVCEGYAKTYLLLLRIEGIESYRVTMGSNLDGIINADTYGERFYGIGYGTHAFVAIKMRDGKLYYSDPEQSFVNGAQQLQMLQQFIVPPSLFIGYSGVASLLPDIECGSGISDIYKSLMFDGVSLYVTNKEELSAVLDKFDSAVSGDGKYQISIFCDERVYTNIATDIRNKCSYEYRIIRSSNASCTFSEYIIYI